MIHLQYYFKDMIENSSNTYKLESMLNAIGINALNEMQSQTIETFSTSDTDTIVLSPTGSGKTLAYLISILKTLNHDLNEPEVVIVLPTRELVKQVADVWNSMKTEFKAASLYGGHSMQEETAFIKNNLPILIIATPGRLNDHFIRKTFHTQNIKLIVFDEFDKSLELGFKKDMEMLISYIPPKARRFLLSATDSEELSQFIAYRKFQKLDFTNFIEKPHERMVFNIIRTNQDKRLNNLFSLLCLLHGEQAIVFCNFREMVDLVYSFLKKKGLPVVAYHGGMEQKQRELALYKFKEKCSTVLVCTDLASRGLDIPELKHIIHFQRPINKESFIHRNGRTARWSAEGFIYMFFIENLQIPEYIPNNVKELDLKCPIPMPVDAQWKAIYIGRGKHDKISRGDIAGFFYKKGGIKPDDLGTIVVYDRYAYAAVRREKVRSLLSFVSGEKIKGIKTKIEEIKTNF